MKFYWEYLLAAAIAVVFVLLAWFLPPALARHTSDLWILRGGIAALGTLAVGSVVWWGRSKRDAMLPPVASAAISAVPSAPSGGGGGASQQMDLGAGSGSTEDIDLLIREASQRLAKSRLGKGATLGNLPAIFVLGDTNSAKTTTVVHSGLDAELLSGQAMQEGNVVPTRAANFWLARKTIFAEAGSPVLKDTARWTRLVKKLMPGRLHSVFGKKQMAPRAALVCFDCETFTKQNAQDAVASAARLLHHRLGEISQLLGISFPVYVLFTRADRLPFFTEYARTLSNDEIAQVFGTTLPQASSLGVYAEQETKRLSAVFNSLFHSLSDWRVPLLSRELDPTHQPGIYEFPREFRKLRSMAAQFMVDLCRPSQLRTAPFLRGFYFTGLRTVQQAAVGGTATMVAPSPFQAAPKAESATRMMSASDAKAMLEAEMSARVGSAQTREVTQFVFLGHLFSHVILQDQAALGASASSTRVSGFRRVLYATAAVLGLIASICFLVSFIGNRSLESRVTAAAKAVPSAVEAEGQPPSLEALQKLDVLRQELDQLNQWQRDGAPWRLRMGLYAGNDIQPDARKAYFTRFHQLLFGETQAAMRSALSKLPTTPGPTDEYSPFYDQLKAYLITTSHPDKSTREWLAPVLQRYWPDGRNADEERRKLALKQFEFYSDELKVKNPFSSDSDLPTVERARFYLSKFAATEKVYRTMKLAAAKKIQPFNFNRKYPETAGVVNNNVEVESAFLKDGWAFMQNAIKNPRDYLGGEEWVLGPQAAQSIDFPKLETDLRTLYLSDFIRTWREVVTKTGVAGYAGIQDASQKLLKHSGNQPPLMVLFCEVSANTAVDSPDVLKAFQSVQQVQPPGCLLGGVFVQPPNNTYVQALQPLQACLEQVNIAPPDQKEAAKGQCLQGTIPAKAATRQVTVALKPDQEAKLDKTLERLMLEPIVALQPITEQGPATAGLCQAFNRLRGKYPFTPGSPVQATLDEFGEFFRPASGTLSQFYEQNLKASLSVQGAFYVPTPNAPIKVSQQFLRFFNDAMSIQRALFPANSPTMRYDFAVKPITVEGGQSAMLTVNGTSRTTGIVSLPLQYTWPGAGEQKVTLTLKGQGGSEFVLVNNEGPWAMVKFLENADKLSPMGPNGYRMERTPRSGRAGEPVLGPDGKPIRIIFDVDSGAAPFIFHPRFLSGMSCPVR